MCKTKQSKQLNLIPTIEEALESFNQFIVTEEGKRICEMLYGSTANLKCERISTHQIVKGDKLSIDGVTYEIKSVTEYPKFKGQVIIHAIKSKS